MTSSDAEQDARSPLARLAAFLGDHLLAPLIVAVASGVLVFLLTTGEGETDAPQTPTAPATATQPARLRPPRFPVVRRGAGRERLNARGRYAGQELVARGALVLNSGGGVVRIVFHPEPTTCAVAYAGRPDALSYEAIVTVSPATLRALPVGRPLRSFQLWWHSAVDGHPAADESDMRAQMTLTAVDTSAGGFWRGHIEASGRSADEQPQRFAGSFAAEWCPRRQS